LTISFSSRSIKNESILHNLWEDLHFFPAASWRSRAYMWKATG